MSISYDQFIKYAMDLKAHSDLIDDNWIISEYVNPLENKIVKYLSKNQVLKAKKCDIDESGSEYDNTNTLLDIMCEYHVLYSPTYCCPDLYFNMWFTDGRLLSLENIWSLVNLSLKNSLIADKWNAITQKYHPMKNIPFYTLHPCKTTEIIELLSSSTNLYTNDVENSCSPLIAWLSTISPLVGLNVDLSYGIHKKNIL
ncbi:ubiquitin-like-conjugating enzyme ATG10 [Daktulosphaira vitifoliae]|uniref:ubiquitin-like-conjugating enzyme ATG10 n=1 Tax=Daktulosphaira vitifoliae TaxID=58002 RepID=UPI0021AA9FD0|nr:ubiquitin-like-conjugating enzyme ATG10 [Daktulosphaira vitifoliae]